MNGQISDEERIHRGVLLHRRCGGTGRFFVVCHEHEDQESIPNSSGTPKSNGIVFEQR